MTGWWNGDLDRTHRQQAFIDSIMHELRTQGVLGDLSKVSALLSVAKQYVITDAGWNLLDFASQMRGLSSGNLLFRTLPIKGYATIDGQDANQVSVPDIEAIVHAAFFPKPAPRRTAHRAAAPVKPSTAVTTVDVLNGGSTTGLAARISAALVKAGYRAGSVGNTAARPVTSVSYGPGAAANGAALGPDIRRRRRAQLVPRAGARADPARRRRRAAWRAGCQHAGTRRDGHSQHRAARRGGDRQGWHSLRQLTGQARVVRWATP